MNLADVTPPNEDDALMLRLQEGDRQAFDQLVMRHQPALMGFFVRHLSDRQLAEDLTQETLLKVYYQAWDYLPRGRFRGWLFRIARNLLIDSTRRRSHDALVRAIGSEDHDGEDRLATLEGREPLPERLADQHEVTAEVESLLPELPEEQKLTFLLYHFAGLSLPEIAEALETNLPTTKSRMRLARQKLQELLKERGFQDPNELEE